MENANTTGIKENEYVNSSMDYNDLGVDSYRVLHNKVLYQSAHDTVEARTGFVHGQRSDKEIINHEYGVSRSETPYYFVLPSIL